MNPGTKRRARFLVGFSLYFAVLWLLWETPVVIPLKLFVVLLHELSHGLVAMLTGGEIQAIEVTPDEGGLCRCPGGDAFLTLSAGYLGSLGWGATLLALGIRSPGLARRTIGAVGAIIVLATLLYVRNLFGLLFGVLFGTGLLLGARRLPSPAARVLLIGLGLTSCLYAILDIKSDVLDRPHLTSDAALLAEITGVHGLVWGLLWIGIALAVSWTLFRWAWRRSG